MNTELENGIEVPLTDIDRLNAYVKKKVSTYQKKWDINGSLNLNEKIRWFISWNWAALLFSSLWFAYRKMYKIALIIAIGTLLTSSLSDYLLGNASWIYTIAEMIGIGIIANYLYLRKANKDILKIKEKGLKTQDELNELGRAGGTSVGAVWLLIGLNIILAIAMYLIFG
ncbi:DUF2628 domain-containing protein [Peribacillus deserti]|uniref:DUF2628 domain-containing protein n=1 Tax=Peribacillus deserti TaxID=673318 RepID=UPI0015E08718|nr:DUF2628 domain-containing protein [Peribacillus deserti]